jgi:peptidoglycan DL-endopeptidase CwlO
LTGIAPVDNQPVAPPQPAPPVAPADGFAAALRQRVTLGQFLDFAADGQLPTAGVSAAAGPDGAALAFQTAGPVATGERAAVVEAAKRYLGVPYKWGGTNPAVGLDCSGFVQRVYADLGISLPRVSVDQSKAGQKVASLDQAVPGDLVFRRGSPNHIGIYLGDGQFIHAPRRGDVVKVAPLTWKPDEIRRIL